MPQVAHGSEGADFRIIQKPFINWICRQKGHIRLFARPYKLGSAIGVEERRASLGIALSLLSNESESRFTTGGLWIMKPGDRQLTCGIGKLLRDDQLISGTSTDDLLPG
jgi:hypothetical protein